MIQLKSGEKGEWQDWIADENLDQELMFLKNRNYDEKKFYYMNQ